MTLRMKLARPSLTGYVEAYSGDKLVGGPWRCQGLASGFQLKMADAQKMNQLAAEFGPLESMQVSEIRPEQR